jgi:hypothetical protein
MMTANSLDRFARLKVDLCVPRVFPNGKTGCPYRYASDCRLAADVEIVFKDDNSYPDSCPLVPAVRIVQFDNDGIWHYAPYLAACGYRGKPMKVGEVFPVVWETVDVYLLQYFNLCPDCKTILETYFSGKDA